MATRPTLDPDAAPRQRPEPAKPTALKAIRAIPKEIALSKTPEGHFGGECTLCGQGLGVYSKQADLEEVAADHAYYDHGADEVPPAPEAKA